MAKSSDLIKSKQKVLRLSIPFRMYKLMQALYYHKTLKHALFSDIIDCYLHQQSKN